MVLYNDFSLCYQEVKVILSSVWSIRTFWYKAFAKIRENSSSKKGLFLKDNSPGLKAEFSQRVNKSMNLTIHQCVVNIIPVTNPTQYNKSDK